MVVASEFRVVLTARLEHTITMPSVKCVLVASAEKVKSFCEISEVGGAVTDAILLPRDTLIDLTHLSTVFFNCRFMVRPS